MLDLKLIRSEPDRVRDYLGRKGGSPHLERILELDPERRKLLGALACCRNQAHRDGLAQTLDVKNVTQVVVPHNSRSAIAKLGIDASSVGIWWLRDVRVGRDDHSFHAFLREGDIDASPINVH